MEPLFTTQTAYTYEEYKKFNFSVMKIKKMAVLFAVTIILYLLVILGWIFIPNNSMSDNFIYIIGILILVEIILVIFIPINIKSTYRSNKTMMNGSDVKIDFYNDHFEEASIKGTAKVDYKDLYKIIETKTHFYLMLAKNQGGIIIKQNCTPELIAFLQELKKKVNIKK